jgi:tight adherence protein C
MNITSLIFTGLLTVAAFAFAVGLTSWAVQSRDPVRRRLAALVAPRDDGGPRREKVAARIAPLGRWLLPGSKHERARVSQLLHLAGFRAPNALAVFFGAKVVIALVLPVVWLGMSRALPTLSATQVWFLAVCVAFLGLLLPNQWLEKRVARRQKRLRDAFPDALDLLVICVEAGLGLTAAIERVALELKYSHSDLASELAVVNAEMRAGVDREAALHGLTERTGLPEIRGLVGLLVQTLRFGTGIADTLRVYAAEFRDTRTQLAEERAAKIGTKLIFPLIFCEFPAFFAIAIGPAALRIVDIFQR